MTTATIELSVDQIVRAIATLPEKDRMQIAAEIVGASDVQDVWPDHRDTVLSRLKQLDDPGVETVSHEETMTRLRAKLAKHRS